MISFLIKLYESIVSLSLQRYEKKSRLIPGMRVAFPTYPTHKSVKYSIIIIAIAHFILFSSHKHEYDSNPPYLRVSPPYITRTSIAELYIFSRKHLTFHFSVKALT